MSLSRPFTEADIAHLRHLVDLAVASGLARWNPDVDGAAWRTEPTIDLLIRYWASVRVSGTDVFEFSNLQPGATWHDVGDQALEMLCSYLDEVARGDHGNKT